MRTFPFLLAHARSNFQEAFIIKKKCNVLCTKYMCASGCTSLCVLFHLFSCSVVQSNLIRTFLNQLNAKRHRQITARNIRKEYICIKKGTISVSFNRSGNQLKKNGEEKEIKNQWLVMMMLSSVYYLYAKFYF